MHEVGIYLYDWSSQPFLFSTCFELNADGLMLVSLYFMRCKWTNVSMFVCWLSQIRSCMKVVFICLCFDAWLRQPTFFISAWLSRNYFLVWACACIDCFTSTCGGYMSWVCKRVTSFEVCMTWMSAGLLLARRVVWAKKEGVS